MSDTAVSMVPPRASLSLLRERLADERTRELVALYAVYAATIAAPLVVVPYAARVLGPERWGVYSIFHSLALYTSMLVEYGFNLSAAREVARLRNSSEPRARLLADVFAAKLILSVCLVALVLGAGWLVPILHEQPALLAGALLFALSQGMTLVWYFQGLEQVRRIAAIEIGGRALAIVFTVLLVSGPGDAWLLLAVNGTALLLVVLAGAVIAIRDCGLSRMTLSGARKALREGFSLFFFRGAVSLYTVANGFVLGMFAPPTAVGFYTGAERICKGVAGLLQPLIQAYYARVNHAAGDPEEFRRLRLRSLYVVSGTGLALGAALFLFASHLVRVVLGPGFEPAVSVLRILALIPPITAFSTTLGVHGLLPLGRDRAFNTVIALAAVLNLILAAQFASRWQQTGMSTAVVATETFVAVAFLIYLWRNGLHPLAQTKRNDQ